MACILEAEGLTRTYAGPHGDVRVLQGAGLAVADGESVAVIGASGAGKSTLLHILGGLDRPDAGRVCFEGEDLYALPERLRTKRRAERIGFVFQAYHLLPEMNVLENVLLPSMARHGAPGAGRRARARAMELLEGVGLADRAQHRPLELSGGEQQRAAVARALMNDPRLVLADEPTGNLDDANGARVMEHLFALTRRGGHALVVVTHNTRLAASCSRALRLTEGRIGD